MLGAFCALALMVPETGCYGGPVRVDPSPQHPVLGRTRPTRDGLSSLVIFTERWFDPNLGSGDDGSVLRPTGYTLYDDQGRKIRYVRNSIGALDQEPTILDADPGRYLVLPDKPGRGPSLFWVIVEPGKRTEVHLEE